LGQHPAAAFTDDLVDQRRIARGRAVIVVGTTVSDGLLHLLVVE
jgi:hypothetical protein